jgi:hypothetical protein
MAALLDVQLEDPREGVSALGVPQSDALTQGLYGTAAAPNRYAGGANVGEAIKAQMPDLVKGAGLRPKGGNMPLTNQTDIMTRSAQAAIDLRGETYKGFASKSAVVRELNQGWLSQYGALKTALMQPSQTEVMAKMMASALSQHLGVAAPDLVRSFTAGNLGIGSVYGLTPFNLLTPLS